MEDEVHGFRYFEERDLLGFVGGTENPGGQAAAAAVLVGPEDPRFTGGSYVIAQKYLHDMRAWHALQRRAGEGARPHEAAQHRAARRCPAGQLPSGADRHHRARRRPAGRSSRDKMPFGSAGRGEFGTYFVGYAASPGVTEQMLANMFIGDPPGNYDRILDFSAAVTGCMFFVPSADFLRDPPGPPGLPAREPAAREPAAREPAAREPAAREPAAREPDLADVERAAGHPPPARASRARRQPDQERSSGDHPPHV